MSRINNTDWPAIFAFVWIALLICMCGAAVWGYIANVVAIARSTDILTPMFILRVLGLIVVPLGAVMGFV